MWEMIFNYLRFIYHSYELIPILLELLLIGFVVYSVMRFLRGTGGEKLFRGIVFLLLGFWAVNMLSDRLSLERITLLFNYFLVGVLIVAAIAFQSELRRGLMRLGGTHFGRAVPEIQRQIEEIVEAISFMSRTQIGALIALEREVGLGDLISSGSRLDAEISASLLNTLFWPGTPLHDMGVVIRRGRVVSAGVQFPLAEYGEYDRMLGSRHRAAIGLSKECDAAIIVVSEETGNIGLALEGKLQRFLTLEQLRQQLIVLMMPEQANQKKPPFPKSPESDKTKGFSPTQTGPSAAKHPETKVSVEET